MTHEEFISILENLPDDTKQLIEAFARNNNISYEQAIVVLLENGAKLFEKYGTDKFIEKINDVNGRKELKNKLKNNLMI